MVFRTLRKRELRYLITLFSLCCLLALPHDAFGADQGYGSFWYGPDDNSVEGVSYIKTGVVASNKYDAALYALGFSQSTVTGISNSKKNSLKSNSTFSSFAGKLKTGKPDDDAVSLIPGIPTVGLNTNSMLTAWYAAKAMYGESNCYWGIYSDDSADSAKDAARNIIKSGTEVGGGTGTTTPAEGVFPRTLTMYKAQENGDYGDTFTVTFDETAYTYIVDTIQNNNIPDNYWLMYIYDNNQLWLATYSAKPTLNFENGYYTGWTNNTGSSITWYTFCDNSGTVGYLKGLKYTYDSTNKVMNVTKGTIRNFDQHTSSGQSNTTKYDYLSVQPVNNPVEPPTDWPDPEPPVTPPEPPDPTTPEPPNPWIPIPDEDVDITGDDFQDLLDALNEHCIHLQNSISSNISQLWQLQSDLFSDHMNTFWDNLHNDLLWLGECLNFDVNVNVDGGGGGGGEGSEGDSSDYVPYDDTSVIYWLKQIWSKLGNGINTKPVDPVINPNGWWDWFSGLLAGLIGSLADIGLDKIGGLVDALDTLREKFPFCIPWDIAALLGLLVSEPVTPVIEVPLMALSVSNGVQEVGNMTIDLAAYNDAWEAVRWIERIAFCVYLATRTKDFLDLLGKIKG